MAQTTATAETAPLPPAKTALSNGGGSSDGDNALVAAFFQARDAARRQAAHSALCDRASVLLEGMTWHLSRSDEEQGTLYSLCVERFLRQLEVMERTHAAAQKEWKETPPLKRAFGGRGHAPKPPISHLGGFLRGLAANVRRDYLIQTRPEWRQLYQNLRFACRTTGSGLVLWKAADPRDKGSGNGEGRMVCGRDGWENLPVVSHARLLESPEAVVRAGLVKLGGDAARTEPRHATPRTFALAVFEELRTPILFSHLHKAAARVYELDEAIYEPVSLSSSGGGGAAASAEGEADWDITDPGTPTAIVVERRALLRVMWDDLCIKLNLPQRKSILLARSEKGGGSGISSTKSAAAVSEDNLSACSLLELFHLTCALPTGEMANALKKTPPDFEIVWRTLPWNDGQIAHDIPTSPDMVRQHRKKARQLLAALGELFERGTPS